MEPENTLLEKENHLPNHHFQVLCQSSGVYTSINQFQKMDIDFSEAKVKHGSFGSRQKQKGFFHLSDEKTWLFRVYVGDCTTQLYGDFAS